MELPAVKRTRDAQDDWWSVKRIAIYHGTSPETVKRIMREEGWLDKYGERTELAHRNGWNWPRGRYHGHTVQKWHYATIRQVLEAHGYPALEEWRARRRWDEYCDGYVREEDRYAKEEQAMYEEMSREMERERQRLYDKYVGAPVVR